MHRFQPLLDVDRRAGPLALLAAEGQPYAVEDLQQAAQLIDRGGDLRVVEIEVGVVQRVRRQAGRQRGELPVVGAQQLWVDRSRRDGAVERVRLGRRDVEGPMGTPFLQQVARLAVEELDAFGGRHAAQDGKRERLHGQLTEGVGHGPTVKPAWVPPVQRQRRPTASAARFHLMQLPPRDEPCQMIDACQEVGSSVLSRSSSIAVRLHGASRMEIVWPGGYRVRCGHDVAGPYGVTADSA
ncbi:hypothetical protein [Micromonospora sp. NBS 11-29]|uniref:hypothetical protein n=1 Tax=Micromonospora sp. NBS 11-29 TaxID=1960879 RepID=UPI000B779B89|nr:hypothetical protein [Micromonospora sp. NBS 11-29]